MTDTPVQPRPLGYGRFAITVATVTHVLPFTNCVMIEEPGHRPRPALVGSALGHVGHGGRETLGIMPGARAAVLVAVDSETEAYVLRILPDPVGDTAKSPLDFMQQGGGSTAFTERLLYDLIFATGKPFTFAHAGTPVDLQPGEWALLNDFGGGLGLERFASWLRASEFCAIYADSLTDTMRTISRTLVEQTGSAAAIDTLIDKLGPARISTRALFRAEAYGLKGDNETPDPATAFAATGANTADISPSSGELCAMDVQRVGATELRLAPRVIEAEGSVIGGVHRSIVVPTFTPDGKHIGGATTLLREFRGLDGVYSVESRRGIHIWKTAEIAAPVADTAEPVDAMLPDKGYAVDPFVLDADLMGDTGFVLAAYEYHAFLANIGAGTPLTAPGVATAAPLPKTDEQWQRVVSAATDDVTVSPLAKPVRFYRTSAGIDIMPDGSVVITDAWGAQIIMGGGNIVMTAPGDIYQTPGRNAVTLATGDIIARAKNDVDVSSSQGSIRVKAEVNLTALAGNGGKGGVLIESRGTNNAMTMVAGKQAVYGGIALKSSKDIVEVAEGGIERKAVQIADRAAAVTTEAGNYDIKTSSLVVGTGDSLYLFADNLMTIPADIIAQGNVHVKGRSRFGGWLYVEREGIFSVDNILTEAALVSNGPAVVQALSQHNLPPNSDKLPVKDPFDKKLNGDSTTRNTVRDAVDARVQAALDQVVRLDQQLWAAYNAGIGARYTDAVISGLAFSFRFDLEYLGRKEGAGFTLPAALWQQRLYAAATDALPGWSENPVRFGTALTAPYPGFEAWTGVGNDAAKHGLTLIDAPQYHDPATQGYTDTVTPGAFKTKNVPFAQYPTPTK